MVRLESVALEPEQKLDKAKSVAPTKEAVLRFLDEQAEIFCRRGTVSEIWRVYRGYRVGPYYELRYREGTRQRRVCLGRCAELAEEVRRRLVEMQAARRERRQWDLFCKRQRAHGRELRATLNRELAPLGLRLQGYELRGTRKGGLPKIKMAEVHGNRTHRTPG